MENLQATSYVASTERTKFKESDFTNMEKMDAGCYAIVYKGLYGTFGHVAIKMLNQHEEIPIDCREIDLLLKLSHPHIVTFYGLLVSDYTRSTCMGYVMEYMSTGSLSRVIHNASLSYDGRQVVSWTMQICLGLAHLHSKGIIHRDIKPQNLLLGKTWDDLKISDFGTARTNDADMSLTELVGTLGYIAPEVLEAVDKRQKYSVSADYSLAITLWEITRRERPYSHLKITDFKIAAMILQGERPRLGPSPVSTDFDGLIRRAWNSEASQRPTIWEFLEFVRSTEGITVPDRKPSSDARGEKRKRKRKEGVPQAKVKPNAPDIRTKEITTAIQLERNQTGVPEVPLLIGSYDHPFLQILDVKVNTWKRFSLPLPYEAWMHGTAFYNGEIYIIGGANKSDSKSAYKLTKEMKWTKLPAMSEERRGISNSTVVFDGCIWVIGGEIEDEGESLANLKTVEAYDPTSNSWIRKPDMNFAHSYAAAAVVKSKIFVCGGSDEEEILKAVEYFDPQLSKWMFSTPMPSPRCALAAVVQDGFLTVMGGFNESEEEIADVWRMNVDDPQPKVERLGFNEKAEDAICGLDTCW